MSDPAPHVRVNHGLLAQPEKRLLIWLAHRIPPAINSDHLSALGLIAMQDHRTHPIIIQALQGIQKDVVTERSGAGLALTTIALRVHGVSTDAVERALIALIAADPINDATASQLNVLHLAMTLYALTRSPGQTKAFSL